MRKVIIGIHGLKNKPPKDILKKWWKEAIIEGFKLNKCKIKRFKFDLVYWADLNYETPENPDNWDENNPEHLSSPYAPYEESEFNKVKDQLRKGVRKTIESGLDFIFLKDGEISGFDKIADIAIKRKFSDLYTYYTGDCIAKPGVNAGKEFRARLIKKLKKYKRRQIMLIAHSMGSIIAYDALVEIGKKMNIDYFVTIGSPLGLPVVINKILLEQRKNNTDENVKSSNDNKTDVNIAEGNKEDGDILPPTPEAIAKKWYNIADIDDKIAFVSNIEKKFAPSTKNIRPFDIAVRNNYIYEGKSNPHKIYGYLRSHELSQIIYEFVTRSWLQRLKDFFTGKKKTVAEE
ncbi:MAG: hypothetical protein FWF38_06935 [Spirochaetaceae bacterium]|nr:hypothetical protein [Spirochaetaceae bacterium]